MHKKGRLVIQAIRPEIMPATFKVNTLPIVPTPLIAVIQDNQGSPDFVRVES